MRPYKYYKITLIIKKKKKTVNQIFLEATDFQHTDKQINIFLKIPYVLHKKKKTSRRFGKSFGWVNHDIFIYLFFVNYPFKLNIRVIDLHL